MYVKPQTRVLDATIALASCTPCEANRPSTTYYGIGIGYSQAGGQGFCAPQQFGTDGGAIVEGDVGRGIGGIKIEGDGLPAHHGIGIFLP